MSNLSSLITPCRPASHQLVTTPVSQSSSSSAVHWTIFGNVALLASPVRSRSSMLLLYHTVRSWLIRSGSSVRVWLLPPPVPPFAELSLLLPAPHFIEAVSTYFLVHSPPRRSSDLDLVAAYSLSLAVAYQQPARQFERASCTFCLSMPCMCTCCSERAGENSVSLQLPAPTVTVLPPFLFWFSFAQLPPSLLSRKHCHAVPCCLWHHTLRGQKYARYASFIIKCVSKEQ